MNRVRWGAVALAGVALVAGVTWVVAAQVMRSPADLAAEAAPPEPSEVTAPVERTELVADVVLRSTVSFGEPVPVSLRGAIDVDGDLIVTGVPEEGDEVAEGEVLIEVSGRPVLVIEGEIPMFRDLRPGAEGDDVEQLQAALDRLGLEVGEVDGRFGPATRDAVEALFEQAGYAPPEPSEQDLDRVEQAEERLSAARDQLAQAEAQLAQAREGPRRSERLQAQAAINEAQDTLDGLPDDAPRREVRRAQEQLDIAIAGRDELLEEPDVTAEERAVAAAREERDEAAAGLDRLRERAGTWLPGGELVVVEQLPQRVDDVAVARGDDGGGELVTISSTELVMRAEIPEQDADLVAEGDVAWLRPDGQDELEGELVQLAERPGTDHASDDAYAAWIEPRDDVTDVVGESVRVRIPVGGTDGEVLAVPLVAVFAAADGSSQVEVIDDAVDDDDPDHRRIVTVEPGLSVDGMVEITPIEGALAEGDQVVVGS